MLIINLQQQSLHKKFVSIKSEILILCSINFVVNNVWSNFKETFTSIDMKDPYRTSFTNIQEFTQNILQAIDFQFLHIQKISLLRSTTSRPILK